MNSNIEIVSKIKERKLKEAREMEEVKNYKPDKLTDIEKELLKKYKGK